MFLCQTFFLINCMIRTPVVSMDLSTIKFEENWQLLERREATSQARRFWQQCCNVNWRNTTGWRLKNPFNKYTVRKKVIIPSYTWTGGKKTWIKPPPVVLPVNGLLPIVANGKLPRNLADELPGKSPLQWCWLNRHSSICFPMVLDLIPRFGLCWWLDPVSVRNVDWWNQHIFDG